MRDFRETHEAKTTGGLRWTIDSFDGNLYLGAVFSEAGVAFNRAWFQTPSGELREINDRPSTIALRSTNLTNVLPREILTPDRILNVDFIIHATRDADVSYTVELTAGSLGSSSEDATAQLLVNGEVVARSSAKNSITATVLGIVTVDLTLTQQKVLVGTVLAGSTVRIATSGTGVVTLVAVQETLL